MNGRSQPASEESDLPFGGQDGETGATISIKNMA
jgi:hypothetical protein